MAKVRDLWGVSPIAITLLFVLVPAHADILKFPNGDRLSGTYVGEEGGNIIFSNDILREIRVPADKVELVIAEPVSKEIAAPEETAAAETEAPDETLHVFSRGVEVAREYVNNLIPDGWTGRLSAGVAFTETNAKTDDWSIQLRARKESGNSNYRTHGFYQYKAQTHPNGNVSRQVDKYGANFTWQRDLYEQFFLQSVTGYQRDRVKNIRHQSNQSLGIGYRIFDSDRITLKATPSGTAQYKDAPGIDRHWIGYVTLFQELIYHINDALRLEQSAEGSVNPSHTSDDYEYNTRFAVIASIAEWIDASLSYENNYDNTVGTRGSRREEKVVFALGVPF